MSSPPDVSTTKSIDALSDAARDISRHIAGLLGELTALRHPHAPDQPNPEVIARQVNKIRDQITLLSSVVDDIAR